jgi:type IV pilus assembly protein PilM
MPAVTVVGLDIGSTSIRAAETNRSKDGPVVTGFGRVALPKGVVHSGVIQDPQAVTAALKQLWSAAKLRTRNVVVGVTNPQAVVRETTLSNLPEAELRKSLPYQVRETLPLPVERAVLDFHRLEEPGRGDTVRGLLIAAPRDAVVTAVHAVERSGLHVDTVDLASFALLRCTSRLDDRAEAVVDIGAQATTVVVHRDGTPLIVRTIPRGGAEITDLLATRLDIDADAAEKLKCSIGLDSDARPETAEVVWEGVRPLINEIRSSFSYLSSSEAQARVARIALSGGGALLPGLIDVLAARLGVEVGLADPTIRLRKPRGSTPADLRQFSSSAAVSIGLTLGAA